MDKLEKFVIKYVELPWILFTSLFLVPVIVVAAEGILNGIVRLVAIALLLDCYLVSIAVMVLVLCVEIRREHKENQVPNSIRIRE